MGPRHDQSTYEPSTSLGSAHHLAINAASAPTQGEMESLENARYLRLAKQKKRPKVEGDKMLTSTKEIKNVARGKETENKNSVV